MNPSSRRCVALVVLLVSTYVHADLGEFEVQGGPGQIMDSLLVTAEGQWLSEGRHWGVGLMVSSALPRSGSDPVIPLAGVGVGGRWYPFALEAGKAPIPFAYLDATYLKMGTTSGFEGPAFLGGLGFAWFINDNLAVTPTVGYGLGLSDGSWRSTLAAFLRGSYIF